MSQLIELKLSPEEAKNESIIRSKLLAVNSKLKENFTFRWKKRSLDARSRNIKVNALFEVFTANEEFSDIAPFPFRDVRNGKKIHIVGAGPAGLFAALRAIEHGFCPIIFERGKEVQARRRDLARLNKEQLVNSESNYCFGEGGAGTYSDGKLYTRSKKRGDVLRAMEWLVYFGANPDILVDAHPHIGTNKLPKLIENIRNLILQAGGEVHFENKLTNLIHENNQIQKIVINNSKEFTVDNLILATGHSARDVFELIHDKGIKLIAKPFALGVRVEHRQEFIDKIQYHGRVNDEYIPPASYSLVTQVEGRGVYSFCMCPGGIIAPCATEQNEVVTNGWSPSKRNNPYANSGIVVSVYPEDFEEYSHDPFVCLNFQKQVEKSCWEAAGHSQKVPAQCLKDFIENKVSIDFPRSSYQPGIVSVNLNDILPEFIARRLRQAFIDFDKKMPGFITNDAVLHAPESRTSSPIQIPRDPETCQHPDLIGLYPCAEGAGYAGGIISAALDGMKCVDAIALKIESTTQQL